jgi:1,4-alpha-glucan branching enzyme
VPNIHGGRENLESIDFLRRLNRVVAERAPGAITLAEESTAWPGVSAPESQGGLGFQYKWNMGWMHDTLSYMARDPVHRSWHQNEMTFGMVYAYTERFVLPLSHDEVVHGKGSLLGKMPGDRWRKFANLRAYLAFMWTHPGKKLLFMGGELGQEAEWNHDAELAWDALGRSDHAGLQKLVGNLNRLYASTPALHQSDADPRGFRWLADDPAASVLAFLRTAGEEPAILFAANLTPEPRQEYVIGVPFGGVWDEVLNTDSSAYGGADIGNGGQVHAQETAAGGERHSLRLVLPPLGAVILRHRKG